jgi:glycosyltransferase involved in cell wall biosynthesis
MIAAWSLLPLRLGRKSVDVVVVGTDPICSVLIAYAWRLLSPQTKIAHWCFDVYPEAAVADGVVKGDSSILRMIRRLLRGAYRKCDLIVDIGRCMRRLVGEYGVGDRMMTITPWALHEPQAAATADKDERTRLFGEARLALLYSGTLGRAHSWEQILTLAKAVESDDARFVFSVRGNAVEAMRKHLAASKSANVSIVDYAPKNEALQRLSAADIHVVALRPEFTGTVVPSKFFEALAIGRPVLFVGDPDSAIAGWIRQHEVGWVLASGNAAEICDELRRLATDRRYLAELQRHCQRVYTDVFAKQRCLDAWNGSLRMLLPAGCIDRGELRNAV